VDPKLLAKAEDLKNDVQPNGENIENVENFNIENSISQKDIENEIERLRQTNNRLLEESKRHKAQKNEISQKLLEAEGKKDELISTLREQLEEKQRVLTEHEEYLIGQKIASKVSETAKKYNCEDWDQLMLLGNQDLIEYDEETGAVKGVETFFEDAMRNDRFKKFFIKNERVKTINSTPSHDGINSNWKENPLPHLMALKKAGKMSEYNNAVRELQNDGLLR
jgi:hypothetical protein